MARTLSSSRASRFFQILQMAKKNFYRPVWAESGAKVLARTLIFLANDFREKSPEKYLFFLLSFVIVEDLF